MFTRFSGNENKIIVPREAVQLFNSEWPCSPLSADRHYWFEFDDEGDLVDTDVPEHQDGGAAAALGMDACDFFLTGQLPFYLS